MHYAQKKALLKGPSFAEKGDLEAGSAGNRDLLANQSRIIGYN